MCYAALANRFGVNGDASRARVERVGVYVARAGRLYTVSLADCGAEADEKALVEHLVAP